MGMIADVVSGKKTFSATSPLARFLTAELAKRLDPPDPDVGAAVNAVHTITKDGTNHTGGTFTITVTLRNGETFTTAGIAYNASAATIETALDTAATTASITGWTNGDITVSGGNLQTAAVVLTFDGASVAGICHPISSFNGASLTGGAEPTTRVTRTTAGQTTRKPWALLKAWGVISGTIPAQDAAVATTGFTAGGNLRKIPQWVVRELLQEGAAIDANWNNYYTAAYCLGIEDRAPLVEKAATRDIL